MSEDLSKDAKESFSQFLARVFDQLSITAWLPAMMVVAIALLLSQLARSSGSLVETFDAIGKIGAAGIVFLIASVILTAMFTQAFEFDAIRIGEGYWRASGMIGWISDRKIRKHLRAKKRLEERRTTAASDAVFSARGGLRENLSVGSARFDALETLVANRSVLDTTTDADLDFAELELVPVWRTYADPQLVAKLDAVDRLLEGYPRSHRVLPTRLGNVMRAAEDELGVPPNERLENFVLHRLDAVPPTIARNYREQRRRLDLYCGLVVVFLAAIAPAVGVALSFPRDMEPIAVGIAVPSFFAAMTIVSYRAAIATARKLGYALVAIKESQFR